MLRLCLILSSVLLVQSAPQSFSILISALFHQMLRLCLILSSVLLVRSAPQSLPADLTADACPNYPFCGPTPLEIPKVFF